MAEDPSPKQMPHIRGGRGPGAYYAGALCRVNVVGEPWGTIYKLCTERCPDHEDCFIMYGAIPRTETVRGFTMPKRLVFDQALADKIGAVSAKIEDYQFELQIDPARLSA